MDAYNFWFLAAFIVLFTLSVTGGYVLFVLQNRVIGELKETQDYNRKQMELSNKRSTDTLILLVENLKDRYDHERDLQKEERESLERFIQSVVRGMQNLINETQKINEANQKKFFAEFERAIADMRNVVIKENDVRVAYETEMIKSILTEFFESMEKRRNF